MFFDDFLSRSSPEVLATKFFKAVGSLRDKFTDRINEINTLTETSVMSATKHLSRIVEHAQRHLSQSKGTISKLNNHGNVNEILTRQNQLINRYKETMERFIAMQQELSNRAEESLKHITKAASDIDRLANESQFLSLNARIEAGLLGKNGAGMSVIAGEMHRLSKSTEAANQFINNLSTSLLSLVPKIGATVKEMRSSSEGFAKDISTSTSEVESVAQSLYEMSHALVRDGDQLGAQIIQDSHSALSALQFQDVVAQGLMRVDKWFWEIQVDCAKISGTTEEIKPPLHIEIGDEKNIQQENHGEVLLF